MNAVIVGLAYIALIVGLLIAAVWTRDWEWAATAVILVLPTLIVSLLPHNRKKDQ